MATPPAAAGSDGSGPATGRDEAVDAEVHRVIRKVTADLEQYHFNTAVAALMELARTLQHAAGPSRDDGVRTLLLLLAPLAPHICEELWHRRGEAESVHQQPWPAYDEAVAARRDITLIVQVDGKVRDRLSVRAGLGRDETEAAALASPRAHAAIGSRAVKSVIVVPDRLVNVVTAR